jgi:hypothetical protein
MTKLKTTLGLCTLLATAICALGAQGASAQTAYTCEPVASGATFKDAHCKEAGSGSGFKHTVIAENVETPITLTNETTNGERSILRAKTQQSGVTLELTSTEMEGEGVLVNRREGEAMWTEGSHVLVLKNVTVTSPAGKGCEVVGGKVTTNKLAATSKGLTNEVRLEPFTGETFATFEIKGCSVTALNHVYSATGAVKGTFNGTTIQFIHGTVSPPTGTTGQGTLRVFGQLAGLEGSVTLRMKEGNGIAYT